MVLKNLLPGQQWRNRPREQMCGHEEGEERVRYMERVTWKLTLLYVDSQQEFAIWLRKLKQEFCVNRVVGWGGRWDRGSKGRGYIYIPMADSC